MNDSAPQPRSDTVRECDKALQALRDTINASIAEGGHCSDDDLTYFLDATSEALAKEGY